MICERSCHTDKWFSRLGAGVDVQQEVATYRSSLDGRLNPEIGDYVAVPTTCRLEGVPRMCGLPLGAAELTDASDIHNDVIDIAPTKRIVVAVIGVVVAPGKQLRDLEPIL